jgi:hypothetical protein
LEKKNRLRRPIRHCIFKKLKNNWPAALPLFCAEFGNWPVALPFYSAEFGAMSDESEKKFACGAILMWFYNNLNF